MSDNIDSVWDVPNSLSGVGKAVWEDLAPKLSALDSLSPEDRYTLEVYCMTYEELSYWSNEIQNLQATKAQLILLHLDLENPDVRQKWKLSNSELNNAFAKRSRCAVQLLNYGSKLALNPRDRGSLKIKKKKFDPLAEMQKGLG